MDGAFTPELAPDDFTLESEGPAIDGEQIVQIILDVDCAATVASYGQEE